MKKRYFIILIFIVISVVSGLVILMQDERDKEKQEETINDVVFIEANALGGGNATIEDGMKKITYTSKNLVNPDEMETLYYKVTNGLESDASITVDCSLDTLNFTDYIEVMNAQASYNIPVSKSIEGGLTVKLLRNDDYEEGIQVKFICTINTFTNEEKPNTDDEELIPWDDNGVFSEYYNLAYEKLKTLTLEEKIGQLLMMSYSNSNPADAEVAIKDYHVGGVLFFGDAFKNKTSNQVKTMINNLQEKSNIPLMTAVDEEGGIVVRISSNPNLASEKFKSSQELYGDGSNGFKLIEEDTINKSKLLKSLGLNMNFAPVVDMADSGNFIFSRTLGQGKKLTGEFAKSVITSSKGLGVSYSLKHFPGYGNNADTHTGSATDSTSLKVLKDENMYPFSEGITAGAEAIMINHNIYSSIDSNYPASLSSKVHDILFDELNFTGLSITDDLAMNAIGSKYEHQYLKAFEAGNHILLTSTSYKKAFNEILDGINSLEISIDELNERVFKVLAWKYYIGLLT